MTQLEFDLIVEEVFSDADLRVLDTARIRALKSKAVTDSWYNPVIGQTVIRYRV